MFKLCIYILFDYLCFPSLLINVVTNSCAVLDLDLLLLETHQDASRLAGM